jgi:hypothetical protein
LSKNNTWLLDYKNNVYSQGGEDGIIQRMLEILPETDSWCVEFGALDGRYLSNTCNLIENKYFSAVLIEADKKKFQTLETQYSGNNNVTTLNQFVGFDASDSLDRILTETLIPTNFDLLSIDIDGNDYHVWQAFSVYQPKIVIVEFNPTIPTHVEYVQEANPNVSKGSSLKALVELGKSKGYELVSVLKVNAIFVKAEYFPLFEIANNSPAELRLDLSSITYLYVGYDGEIILDGKQTLPWHRMPINSRRLQMLPKMLRKFPGDYTLFQKVLFAGYLLVRNPREFKKQFRQQVLGRD